MTDLGKVVFVAWYNAMKEADFYNFDTDVEEEWKDTLEAEREAWGRPGKQQFLKWLMTQMLAL